MNSVLLRTLLVYGLVLPLAVLVGWMLSSPLNVESLSVVGAVLFILILPLILAHHYAILVFSLNAFITVFFLPGQPQFWALMVVINLAMALFYRILQRRPLFIHVPSMTFTVILFALVIVVTAKVRGGIGVRALGGSSYGGKPMFYTVLALLGYFAFAAAPIPWDKIKRYTGMLFLSNITAIISHLIYLVPALWFLFAIFPTGFAMAQVTAEYTNTVVRWSGLAIAAGGILNYMLLRFGVSGLLSVDRLWRPVAFCAVLFAGLLGGYRSSIVLVVLVMAILFILEGLLKTRWAFIALVACGLGYAALIPTARMLPTQVQRAVSVLPLDVDPLVRQQARESSEWRLQMWQALLPELPRYFWLGKGYALSPTDMYLTQESVRRGFLPSYSSSLVVGDYHNGPLSVYIPLGFPGVLAFVAMMIAFGRALYFNYKYGDPRWLLMNRFLFAFFMARTIFFLFVFGALASDLSTFTAIAGLSVALNRGVCRKPVHVTQSVTQGAGPLGLAPRPA